MGLVVGEKFTRGRALKGVLVQSGNDAATLMAEHVGGGSLDTFVKMMNAKAAALDLDHTHYVNVDGLDTPGTTPRRPTSSPSRATRCAIRRSATS